MLTEVTNLVMESCGLDGEVAVLVHQEAEAPLLLQQSLSTAVSDELLHVHLTVSESLETLQRTKRTRSQVVISCPTSSAIMAFKIKKGIVKMTSHFLV